MENTENKNPNCLNCKFAGEPFDLGATTHIYCKHPKNKELIINGVFEPLDTLMEGDWLCALHQFTPSQTPDQ